MKMEVLTYIVELIPTVGFPIACVIAMAAFIFYVYKRIIKYIQLYIIYVKYIYNIL